MEHSSTVFVVAGALVIALGGLTMAAGLEDRVTRGEQKAARCAACHGVFGETDHPMLPDLAGQNEGYLAKQLHDFRSGERFHRVMTPIAGELSDADIEDLAAYFARMDTQQREADQ